MSRSVQLITPKAPGPLTRAELALYLQVGRNEIPKILERFELSPVERHFSWRSIWRQLLWLAPADEEQKLASPAAAADNRLGCLSGGERRLDGPAETSGG